MSVVACLLICDGALSVMLGVAIWRWRVAERRVRELEIAIDRALAADGRYRRIR